MSKGFKATLFAGVITLSAFAPAFAAAPVISGLPDVTVGDLEDNTATDNNFFIFTDAFQFSDFVVDAETPDSSQLRWSFAEYNVAGEGLGPNQYTINGVGPTSNSADEIAAEELAGNPKAKMAANQVNTSSDFATFRDVILSPTSESIPFDEPSAAQKTAAAEGKFVRYYVADAEGNVTSREAMVRSLDDGNDSLTTDTDGYQEEVRDTIFDNWVPSGIPSPGVSINNPDTGNLKITVSPTQGMSRILGWKNEALLTYDEVGPSKFVHGKFYVHTTNFILSPINEVPAFRLRITNEVLDAAVHFEYAQTGYTGTEAEPGYVTANAPEAEESSNFVRPGDLVNIPSLYKVDFDPIDVPAAAGTRIGALMESYALVDPANGTLTLTEVVLGTYDAKNDANGNLIYEYNRNSGLAGAGTDGGAKTIASSGVFNAEADFQPGRRQKLFVPQRDKGVAYASITDEGSQGLLATTDPVAQDVFGIGLLNVESVDNVDKLRIGASKFYRAKFYATSDVPAERNPSVEIQSGFRFRFQTGSNTISYLLELVGLAQTVTGSAASDMLAVQALPGPDSQNPDTDASLDVAGEKGGWYSILVSSPLDPNGIREDYEDLDISTGPGGGNGFFTFALQPGPGEAGDSAKDVKLGVDLVQTPTSLRLRPDFVAENFAQQNVSEVRISAIEVYEYAPIDDGGYDFVEETP